MGNIFIAIKAIFVLHVGDEPSQPLRVCTKPLDKPSQPLGVCTKPLDEPSQPLRVCTKPLDEPSQAPGHYVCAPSH